jgi:hypothetical protein
MSKPDSDAAQSFLKLADLVSLDGAVEPMTTIEPETTEQAVPKRRLFGRRS